MKPRAQLPAWFTDRLERQFGSEAAHIMAAFGKARRPTFRVNTLRSSDKEVMGMCREQDIAVERVPNMAHAFMVKNKNEHALLKSALCIEGRIYLQGLTSMVPPMVLDAKPGTLILDLCAAPGSKTSQLAAMMGNRGEIVAVEQDGVRCQKLEHTLTVQGVSIAKVVRGDGAVVCKQWNGQFDAILADVPCSAEGRIVLKDPHRWRSLSQKNIVAHAKMQRRLLRVAVPCLKPDGRLVYSTCTLAPEENEHMMAWLVDIFPNLRPMSFQVPLTVARIAKPTGMYILPTDKHEGMYVALLQNAGSSPRLPAF